MPKLNNMQKYYNIATLSRQLWKKLYHNIEKIRLFYR